MYKIVFTDLDGTLLPDDEIIRPYTKSVIAQVRQLGIPFILASGRSHIAMRRFYEELGLNEPIISFNGALIEENGIATYYQPLPHLTAQKLYHYALEKGYYFQFYHKGQLITSRRYQDSPLFLQYGASNHVPMVALEDESLELRTALKEATKWMFINEERKSLESIAKEIELLASGEANMSFTSDIYFEVYHQEVNKGNAIAQLLKNLKIDPSEAISFGDNFNDVELLEIAGLSYAMQNAPDAVKHRAKKINPYSCDEEGVAKILAELFL